MYKNCKLWCSDADNSFQMLIRYKRVDYTNERAGDEVSVRDALHRRASSLRLGRGVDLGLWHAICSLYFPSKNLNHSNTNVYWRHSDNSQGNHFT